MNRSQNLQRSSQSDARGDCFQCPPLHAISHNLHSHILIVGDTSEQMLTAQSIAQTLQRSIVVTASPHQAVAQAQVDRPHLVILFGDDAQHWSPRIAREIRKSIEPQGVVIVVLTASCDRSWPQLPEVDAHSDIDGVCVTPLSAEVMSVLNESAMAKQECSSALRR